MSANMRTCSGCRRAHYCSPECQKNDWNSHKVLCKANAETATRIKMDSEAAKASGGEPTLKKTVADLKQWSRTQRPELTWAVAQALHLRSTPSNASSLCLHIALERTSFAKPPKSFKIIDICIMSITDVLTLAREKSSEMGDTCEEIVKRSRAVASAQSGAIVPIVVLVAGPVLQLVPAGMSEGLADDFEEVDDWASMFKRHMLGW